MILISQVWFHSAKTRDCKVCNQKSEPVMFCSAENLTITPLLIATSEGHVDIVCSTRHVQRQPGHVRLPHPGDRRPEDQPLPGGSQTR